MPAPATFTSRLDARVAAAIDRNLVDHVSSGTSRGLAHVLACALITPVYLVSAALVLSALVLLLFVDGLWPWPVAAFLLCLAWVTRPHLGGRADPESFLVDHAQAPELTALVKEVAELLDARPPTEIRLLGEMNAYVAQRGLRGYQLALGAPLWMALNPQARVALLGHEIGHIAHGDIVSTKYVGGAHRSLHYWVSVLDASRPDVFGKGTPILARVIMAPPRWIVAGYLRLLVAANAATHRRQELYADISAALAGGTDGAVECLEVTLLAESLDVAMNRASVDSSRPYLGAVIAERVASFDSRQRTAARRDAEGDRRSVDATHPPTVDRLLLIESVESADASVSLDDERNRRIDEELGALLERAFKRLGDTYR